MVDMVVHRADLHKTLSTLLQLLMMPRAQQRRAKMNGTKR
jgi:hypothetical protein